MYLFKGNLKPRKRTLENSTRFSNTVWSKIWFISSSIVLFKVPNSHGHDYGWHLQTELGKEIKNLETSFHNQHKKRLATVVLGYEWKTDILL